MERIDFTNDYINRIYQYQILIDSMKTQQAAEKQSLIEGVAFQLKRAARLSLPGVAVLLALIWAI
ncbi:MAG: hypothetical protein AB1489_27050 [Acidobacteriota bacterium]